METLAEGSPSPKKQYPELSEPHIDDKSVASGDDSKGWMQEEEGMMSTISAQHTAEEKETDELEDIVPAVWYS